MAVPRRSPKMTVADELTSLDFHDSMIREIVLAFPQGHDRKCTFDIDYYNWEGNQEGRAWQWRRLKIYFGYLAAFEYSAPDMINCVQEIDSLVLGEGLEELRGQKERVNESFPQAKINLFDSGTEPTSVKFLTQNGDETADGYVEGYIKAIGSQVELEWIDSETLVGQTHSPIKEEGEQGIALNR